MRRWAPLLLVLLCLPAATRAQIRVERDASGRIVITNKGSEAAKRLSGAQGSTPIPKVSKAQRQAIESSLKAACSEKGLDYNLVAALVQAESDFQPNTLSRKGAVGLMQLLPETAKRFGCPDPWDVEQNIRGGTSFLAYLQGLFGGDIPLMLAAYNAGEDAVRKYSNKIPPYAETVRYVFRILDDYHHPGLVEKAKAQLASPDDYNRYYVAARNYRPVLRVFYMYFDAQGVRTITDYPPSGVSATLIVYKDE